MTRIVGLLVAVLAVTLSEGAAAPTTLRWSGSAPVADTVVRPIGPPLHPRVGQLVAELRIGTLAGLEVTQFGAIASVMPLADGSVIVVDPQTPAVRQFGRRMRRATGERRSRPA